MFYFAHKNVVLHKHHDCCKKAFVPGPVSMDYLQAFLSQMGIKGRLWQTNVFQDGSHETHLVFKVAGFKGMFELGRFSHLLFPLLI